MIRRSLNASHYGDLPLVVPSDTDTGNATGDGATVTAVATDTAIARRGTGVVTAATIRETAVATAIDTTTATTTTTTRLVADTTIRTRFVLSFVLGRLC